MASSKNQLVFDEAQFDKLLHRIRPEVRAPPASGLGNPGPLGRAAFALTTFVLSAFNTGDGVLLPKALEGVVLPLALFYGGAAQFAAGIIEYNVNNTFGATAFVSYGAFWMSFAGYVCLVVPQFAAKSLDPSLATGTYLLGWLIFTSYMTIGAWRVSKAVFTIFALLTPTFLFLTVGALGHSDTCSRIGGWLGLACAFSAWYGSAAVLINTAWGEPILPVGAYVHPPAGTAKGQANPLSSKATELASPASDASIEAGKFA